MMWWDWLMFYRVWILLFKILFREVGIEEYNKYYVMLEVYSLSWKEIYGG